MSSFIAPHAYAFKAGGTIVLGHAVKLSADDTVIECTANTDAAIGVAMNSAVSGDRLEIALAGGFKMVASESIARGKFLVSHTDGTAAQTNTAGDRYIAIALAAAAAGDLFPVILVHGRAVGADD